MPSSVARLVGQDHDRLTRLLRRVCANGPNQDRWRTEFVALLSAHRIAERDELFAHVVGVAAFAGRTRRQAERDVRLDPLGVEVTAADIGSAEFSGLCERVRRELAEHAESLSTEVLDGLEQAVGRKEMRRLGGRYEARRDEELRDARVHVPPPRRLDLSRAELYELARRAGIEGRSSMSREQLISELQRRQTR
jgi:hypothetical protein